MSLVLVANSTPALIIKPRLVHVTHTDDLGWYVTCNRQQQMFIHNSGTIVSKPNVTPEQILYCTTDCIPIDLMFKEIFLTFLLQQQPVLGQEHQSAEVKCSTTCLGLVDSQLIVTKHSCEVIGCNTMAIRGLNITCYVLKQFMLGNGQTKYFELRSKAV